MIMTERRISVADFSFSVTGDSFLNFMEKSGAFRDFFTDRAPDFRIVADLGETEVLKSDEYRGRQSCYEIGFEGISCSYGRAGDRIYFDMVPEEHEVRTGAPEYTGRICVIGAELNEDKLAELFGLA